MDIYIHKDVLGFQHHLVCHDDKLKRVKEIPDDSLLVYGDPSLQEIAKVYGVQVPSFPPPSHVKALGSLIGATELSGVPWQLAMPPKGFKRAVEGLAKDLTESFSGIDLTYYQTHFRRTQTLLHKMKRAKIDPKAWMVHGSNKDLVTPHVFKTFAPDENWFAEDVQYSKADTKTGRLKVMSGPNILHLPKEQRNIIASRFGHEGKVLQLDYRALEPRVLLYLSKNPSSSLSGNPPFQDIPANDDIYQTVLDTLQITNIPRDSVKEVVLSQLYGAGYDTIISKLAGIRDPSGFIEAVNDFFGLNEIRERLLQEYEANGRQFITNYFGRRIDTSDAKPYMLLNYYIQSTAVDVALYGFLNVLRALLGNAFVVPIFILHDALILDVHKSQLELIEKIAKAATREIPMFPGCVFPIKVSRF